VAIEDEMDPDVLRTAVSLRHMLEATLDAWRTTLPEEIPLVAVVMTIVVDVEGFGPINVCVSHPADDPAVVIKAAEQTADLLSETL
jgi:hypothetical protein